ncbi:MAG: ABC transporter substrate binding protein [Peptostreptococcaceae bacterium]
MKRVKAKNLINILIFYMLIQIIPNKIYAEVKTDVLFISSYNPNHIVFEDQVSGIKEGLGDNVNFKVEYMNANENSNVENEKAFFRLLKQSLSIYEKFDVLIVADDEALEFCLKYREELFENIPIVFLAIEDERLIKDALNQHLVTGVREKESVDESINLIRTLHPDVKNIVFLEQYENGKIFGEIYEESVEKYEDINFEKIITTKLSKDEFRKELSKLNNEYAIITFYPNIFINKEWLSHMDVTKTITQNANQTPVYEILSYGVGNGSIGGKVISHFQQGKMAGQIAKDLINGANPKELYVGNDYANQYIFDYDILKKFKIKIKDLPKESTILNHPKDEVIVINGVKIRILTVLLILTIIIFVLIVYLYQRRKYIKNILKAKQAAEEMNNLKAHFISNISHELKTPITVIMSVIQLQKSKNNEYEKNDFSFDIINNNCNRLIRLLDNIIDFEKYERGESDLDLEVCNIIELLEDIVLSVEPYTRARNLDLIFDTDREEVITKVDRKKIERIVLNLLSNAIKYSKDKGKVMVSVHTTQGEVIINVEDNGIGIQEEDLDKIFDRFVQIDNSLTRKNEGSGIGLSIIKAFVNLHKGEIEVKSKINEGTKFIIKLPIEEIENTNVVRLKSNEKSITKIELSDIYF